MSKQAIEKHYLIKKGEELKVVTSTERPRIPFGDIVGVNKDRKLLEEIAEEVNCNKLKVVLSRFHPEDTIKNISQIFCPTEYANVVKSIHTLARWNDGKYMAPTTANQACILIIHLAEYVKCSAIIENRKNDSEIIQDFIYLMQKNQNADITKVANVNRIDSQRSKTESLPTIKEINSLLTSLDKDIKETYQLLKQKFSINDFCKLSQLSLCFLMVFNRKRPGDCERTTITDYQSMTGINEDHFNSLTEHDKTHAKKFMRFISQGKLNKKVSNLISTDVKKSIDLLLSMRSDAGISFQNHYVFADPRGKQFKYFKADQSLRMYCEEKGFLFSKLGATKLRKHLATVTSNLSEKKQREVSDFMGHGIEIHNDIYKQREVDNDILNLGKILLNTSGFDNESVSQNYEITNDSTATDESISQSIVRSFEQNIHSDIEVEIQNYEGTNNSTTENETVSQSSVRTSVIEDKENFNPGLRTPEKSTRIVAKRTWTTPERNIIRKAFAEYIEKRTQPSLCDCQNIAAEAGLLKTRTLPQIKSWLVAEMSREKGNRTASRWATPQKHKCRQYFKRYYDKQTQQKYPSLNELAEAVANVPEFKNKSIGQLRSLLQHDYKYMENKQKLNYI